MLILILIVNISSLARENLTKNKSREKYLNDLKKEQLIIGIVKNDDFKVKNKLGVSIVDLVKEMFLKELKLDVLFIEEDQEKLEVMLKEQKIEGIALINKENEISNQLSLTNILFTKNIYLVSSDIPLNSLNDLRVLNKPKVYFEKGDYKYRIFKEKMKVNDMDIDFYEVDDIKNYQNELILTTQFNKYEFKNKLQVTISPGYIIGLDKKYSKLADVLSEVLSKKYRQKFNLLLEEINKEMSLEYFLSSLTDDEKKYIDNLKKLRISYEENSLEDIYYYSKYYKKSKGLIPMLIERIIEALKINLVVYEDKKEKKLELLEKGEIDFLILSKTMDRDKKYLFSEKIADLNTYVISKKDKSSFGRRVGVLRYNIEEEIVKKYDVSRNIKSYSNYELLKKALDDKEIEYILTTNKEEFELDKYDIRIFEKVPINLAFNLNNPLLKSIVDKALIHLIDIEILKKETYLDIEREK
ncbi:MAG: substrate-binding periplasmic protein, partial [Cetobacterium sp.]